MCFNVRTSEREHINTRDTKSAFNLEEQETEREFHEQQMSCVHVAYLISIITFVHIERKKASSNAEHWLHQNLMESVYDVRSFIFHSLHTHYTLVLLFFSLFYSILILIVKCLCLYFYSLLHSFSQCALCGWCVRAMCMGLLMITHSRAEQSITMPCHALLNV